MFNPVFNKDGSLSYFRVFCLGVAMVCFACGCVMKNDEKQDEKVSVASSVQSETVEETRIEDDSHKLMEMRAQAVEEIVQASEYMQTCGVLDRGYDSCEVTLSDEMSKNYTLNLDASADGFKLTFTATASNRDTCRLYEANSNGELVGFDENGKADKNCLLGLANAPSDFKLVRDTDNRDGQSAPSGFTPIVKHLSLR